MSIYSNRYVILLLACFSSLVQAVPLAHLSADSLRFDAVTIKTISSAKTVTLSNTGDTDLTISDMEISGEFSLGEAFKCYNKASSCTKPALPCTTLKSGEGCTLNVWYTPVSDPTKDKTVANWVVGSLQFTTDSSNNNSANPFSAVALIGTTNTIACDELITTPTVFEKTAIGAKSATKAFTVTAGTSPRPLSIFVSGDYQRTNKCQPTLLANTSCDITVTFSPAAKGLREGKIYFDNEAHFCGNADARLEGNSDSPNIKDPANAGTPVNLVAPTTPDPNAGNSDKTTDVKGCTMGNGVFDPVLALLVLVAALGAYRKRKEK